MSHQLLIINPKIGENFNTSKDFSYFVRKNMCAETSVRHTCVNIQMKKFQFFYDCDDNNRKNTRNLNIYSYAVTF